jgi:hypothetical protein
MKKTTLLSFILALGVTRSVWGVSEITPRESYNFGAEAIAKKQWREAESWLLRATGSQRESIQPPALYDLGHVRFEQGRELLKGESARQPLLNRAETAGEEGTDAIGKADKALKKNDIMGIIEAYMNGRMTRKQLRLANEDVQRALDLYGSVLVRWRRSVGDFRSSDELKNSTDAEHNAHVVERHIKELLKHTQQLQQLKELLAGARAELKKKMAELKGKIPGDMIQPGQGEGDEEDEEEGRDQPKPESGFEDRAGKEGEKRGITPEIAQQILEALGINGDRKLPIGGDEQRRPRTKNAKDW